MAFALAQGLRGIEDEIVVADPVAEQLQRFKGVTTTQDNETAAREADAIVLAVKPQILESVARVLPLKPSQLVISIAAGVPAKAISSWTSERQPVVRCMPNTPALLQAGITGLTANRAVSRMQRCLAERILSSVGDVVWFDNESDLDAVTALSGSGPAYILYILESMIDAGVELGLNQETAKRLAIATGLGAARMADEADVTLTELRNRVTSPGGTTERAISILESAQVRTGIIRAIRGAWQRSRELAKEFGK
jgi:pyrroline-5-carboxylate reductase